MENNSHMRTGMEVDGQSYSTLMVDKDCLGHVFTFFPLVELGTTISRVSKEWRHIVESTMPKVNLPFPPFNFQSHQSAHQYNMRLLRALTSRLGRRHVSEVQFPFWSDTFQAEPTASQIIRNRLYECITNASNLQRLVLGNDFVKDETEEIHWKPFCEAVASNNSITSLDVSWNFIDDSKDLANLILMTSNLLELVLHDCNISLNSLESICASLVENQSIRSLDISSLCEAILGNERAQNLFAHLLLHNHTLVELKISQLDITPFGIDAITSALCENRSIRTIDLSHNEFGEEGAIALATAIQINHSITDLRISNIGLGPIGVRAIANSLHQHKGLTALDISLNVFGSEGSKAFAKVLSINNSIRHLNLEGCLYSSNEVKTFLSGLVANRSISTLTLANNRIDANHLQSVLSTLYQHVDVGHTNASLTSLDLGNNPLLDTGAHMLATALRTNSTVTQLNLANCEITSFGLKEIVQAVEKNGSLTSLNIASNKIGDKDAIELSAMLRKNRHLTHLDLSGCKFTRIGIEAILNSLTHNRALSLAHSVE